MFSKMLGNTLMLDNINIALKSMSVGHGHMQHHGSEKRGMRPLWYHIYIPVQKSLQDLFAFG